MSNHNAQYNPSSLGDHPELLHTQHVEESGMTPHATLKSLRQKLNTYRDLYGVTNVLRVIEHHESVLKGEMPLYQTEDSTHTVETAEMILEIENLRAENATLQARIADLEHMPQPAPIVKEVYVPTEPTEAGAMEGFDSHYNVYLPHLSKYNSYHKEVLANQVLEDIIQHFNTGALDQAQALSQRFAPVLNHADQELTCTLHGYYGPMNDEEYDFAAYAQWLRALEAFQAIVPTYKVGLESKKTDYTKRLEAHELGVSAACPSWRLDVVIGLAKLHKRLGSGHATYKELVEVSGLTESALKDHISQEQDMGRIAVDKTCRPHQVSAVSAEAQQHCFAQCKAAVLAYLTEHGSLSLHHVQMPGVSDVYIRFVCDTMVEEDTVFKFQRIYYHNTVEGLTPLRESLANKVSEMEQVIAELEHRGEITEWKRRKLTDLQAEFEAVHAAIEQRQAVSEPGVIPQNIEADGPFPVDVPCASSFEEEEQPNQ